jgi:tetratricopeptide (TPR) repeat protein
MSGHVAAALPLFLLLLNGCRSASSYLAKGNSLFDRGEYAEASLNYRKALQKDPGNADSSYRLGLSELKENKPAAALQDFLLAVRLAPDHEAARKELSSLVLGSYIADPDRPKALYDLLVKLSDEWIKKDPHSLEGLRIKGYLAMLERRPDEAAELFLRARQSNPSDEKTTLGLMDALFRNNQGLQAEKIGLDFIAAHNTSGDVYDALYRLYQAMKRPADAEGVLIRKVKQNPQDSANLLQLAGHYARVNKKPEMADTLQRFLANPAGTSSVHLQAGDFYAAVGDWSDALNQYETGMASHASDKLLYQVRIGRALLSQNKRPEALRILSEAVAQHPDDKEARSLRAALLVGAGGTRNAGEGLQDLKGVMDQNPDDLFLKYVFSQAQLESGDLAGAHAQLLELVKRLPYSHEARVSLCETSFKLGRMTEASEQALAALEMDPADYRAQLIRGSALMSLGSFDEASTVLNRLARQAPQSVDVRLALSMLDLRRRKYAESEAAFRKILESHPDEWRAAQGLVENALAQNRPEKAFSLLDQELKRTHGAPQVRYFTAMTALKIGKYNTAIENLRIVADQTPDSIDPMLRLADVYRLKGDTRNAIATLQKAALLKPKDTRPNVMLSFLLETDNRKQEAKQQAKRALAVQPDDIASMNNLAYLLAETGDNLDEALKLARKAVSKAPGEPYLADTLGYVYLKKDQNDDALQIFSGLAKKYPNDPTIAYHMGMTWFQKGEMARAKAELRRALESRPSKEIEDSIRDLLSRIG